MTSSSTPDLSLQRWIIGLLWAAIAGLTVTWMAVNWYVQIILIIGVLGLLVEGVVFIALLRHGLRWLFSRRGLVFAGWLLAGVVSVIVLFYAEENWRGRRAWAAVQRGALARGESLEFSSVLPPSVPDEANFVRAPGVSNVLTNPAWKEFIHPPGHRQPEASWALGQFTDLGAWGRHLLRPGQSEFVETNPPPRQPSDQSSPEEVLRAFEPFEPQFQVLRRAAERPGNRFDIDYGRGLFAKAGWEENPYEPLARAGELLCIRASAQLVMGRPEAGVQDVLLAVRLSDCLNREPFWFARYRRTEVLMRALQPVWEGTVMRRWTEPELQILQQRLKELEPMEDLRWSLRAETLLMMNLVDQFQAWRARKASALGARIAESTGSERVAALLARAFYPTGWLYQDKAWMYRFYMGYVPEVNAARPKWWDDSEVHWHMLGITDPMLLVYVVPRFREMFHDGREKGLYLTAATRQAVLACALERYRLDGGKYPDTLQELVPSVLAEVPGDPLGRSGQSAFTYHSRGETYAIYSAGLNLLDEGGKPPPIHRHWQGGQYLFAEIDQGDWVWRQPSPN